MKSDTLPLEQFEHAPYSVRQMQLGVGLSLFMPRPFSAIRPGVHDFWKTFRAFIGEDTLTWAVLDGGNRTRKVTPAVYRTIEDWLSGGKGGADECWISIHHGEADCLGDASLVLEGYGPAGEEMRSVSFIQTAYSVPFVERHDAQALAEHLIGLARHVPFYCGTAGFTFMRSPYAYNHVIGLMQRLSERFHGVEISGNEAMCYWAGRGLASVNWITFVCDHFLEPLGGRSGLRARLPAGCEVWDLDHGVAIRAGEAPSIGDVTAGTDELRLWREVYRVLEPIQFVDEFYDFDPFEFDGKQTVQWLTRLKSRP